jgi:quinol monooxygenase YgiN
MSGFVILAEFRLTPGSTKKFLSLIAENARTSCRTEPGCRRFDVTTASGDPERIMLYEIYDDRAAFDAHLKTKHFAVFNEASAPLIASKSVTEFKLEIEGSA